MKDKLEIGLKGGHLIRFATPTPADLITSIRAAVDAGEWFTVGDYVINTADITYMTIVRRH